MSGKANGTSKDVIYIDVDDEITGIIDKVRGSHSKIVALVLPKRATMLQSIVNMKLLKRSADEAKKNLVLITSEAGIMPLAGSVGMHVAKTLQSKPEVPDAPERGDGKPEDIEEAEDESEAEEDLDKNKSVGELAGAAAAEETIELDNEEDTGAAAAANPAKAKKGKGTAFKIPNFNRFRLLLLLGGLGVVLLIVLGYLCLAVLPKAAVAIKTDSQSLTSSTVVTLKTGDAVKLDIKAATVPAHAQEVQKTVNQQVDATGQQNNGDKASGSITVKNCTADPVTLPTGTAVTSSGLTFITNSPLSLDSGNFTLGGACKSSGGHIGSVGVTSQAPGTKYNIGPSNFTVVGRPSTVTASSSSAMSGGTDDITKIVTQADIDNAKQKIGSQDSSGIKEELKTDLTNLSYYPVAETFTTGTPDTKTSVNAGDPADSVTVTQVIKYTMLGVKQDDLKKIIAGDVKKKIDESKQKILDYGLDDVVFGTQSQPSDGAVVTMQAEVVAGPELNVADIKKQVAGKKAGDAKEIIKETPGVTEVEVHYSPFWVSSIPKKTSKITVTIEKPKAASANNSSNAGSH